MISFFREAHIGLADLRSFADMRIRDQMAPDSIDPAYREGQPLPAACLLKNPPENEHQLILRGIIFFQRNAFGVKLV